ncbi:early nodulin-20-like isoform X3 [Gadus morhua]|uniref:early nodulin-20-like isoform X3 n=1 Tax=Gadus morhua TaxID=8049 RepID=UPI0011B62EC3|nr:early nodulin-20-like isoform X3 [Gadus morhua]
MAATVVDVFLNQSMVAFLDKDRTMPYQGMVAANIHSADCTCTASPAPVRDPTRPPDTPRSRKRSDSTSSPAAADGATSSVSPTRAPSPAQSTSSSSPSPSSSSASPPAVRDPTRASDTPSLRKRTREDDVLAYLERSDAAAMAASQRRHEESLTEMRALREDRRKFLQLFSSMVDKM